MCDIFFKRCKVRGCKTKADLHLADYSTGRDEIAMFCGRHLKDAAKHKRGNLRTEFVWVGDGGIWESKGKHKIAIVPLTENAERNWSGNHPNTASDMAYVHHNDGKMETGTL